MGIGYDIVIRLQCKSPFAEFKQMKFAGGILMKRVFAFLTDYLIKKGLVQEEDRPIYEYGFQILIEIFLWVLCCTIIAALTCSLIELCIFFIIFFPIRSYAGGFHFRKFSVCFLYDFSDNYIFVKDYYYAERATIM